MRRMLLIALAMMAGATAQVYSPKVLLKGQPDATDLHTLAEGIYTQASAHTPRERAEAIWRFFLTDGRFVKPGFWYHIAGWAYEEPQGEVLDPVKLLNSYGFGLCYHIAPLLEAVWKAGGFEDARVWFLTGHTVAEVFYDGAYHYFDSDMMGYNTVGEGAALKSLPIASVHQIETDGNIILSKMKGPKQADTETVDDPWYPADVRAAAIGGLAELFTTASDNRLFPFERSPQGHRMEFVLRPGERLIRYFHPEQNGLYYLPYKFNGKTWDEFPQEIARYHIRTEDGPQSQKDDRKWATGRIEYRPRVSSAALAIYEAHSPYVVIDGEFELDATLNSAQQTISIETSADAGATWTPAGMLRGPHRGTWHAEPAVLTKSAHGRRTAVSGSYGYLVRVTRTGGAAVSDLLIRTRIQLNPRTLPELKPGRNEMMYTAGAPRVRRELTGRAPYANKNARYASEGGEWYWVPAASGPADLVYRVAADSLLSVDAGARFLDLSTGLAPDKFTAEVRRITPLPDGLRAASLAWSRSPEGPFETLWEFDPRLNWKDGVPIDRTLLWPEVDRRIEVSGARDIYVRYRFEGMAVDSIRLATESGTSATYSPLTITHLWKENGVSKKFAKQIGVRESRVDYSVEIPSDAQVENEAVVLECPLKR